MVRPRDLREAVAWVDRSGVAPLIERLLRPNRRGRPRQLSVRTLFVGMKLAVDTSKTACLTDVHALLIDGLSPSTQRDLGVIDPRTGAVISLHQVRRLLSAIQAKLDPSPATAAGLVPEELEQRAASLQEILDLMLAATMPTATAHTGGYAVDGTGTWSWAKGRKREDRSPTPTQPGASRPTNPAAPRPTSATSSTPSSASDPSAPTGPTRRAWPSGSPSFPPAPAPPGPSSTPSPG
ncbi:MAG: hypothetical protein WKF82_05215 [Nocardioidaceae bacterium]